MGKKLSENGFAALSGTHIELFSNKEAVIDGIKGVLEYSDCYIKLNIGRGVTEFWGTGLEPSLKGVKFA